MFRKAIWHGLLQSCHRVSLSINIYRSEHAERAYVINSRHMVVVNMCEQNPINGFEIKRKNLLSEVWSAIYKHPRRFRFQKRRTSEPVVAWVAAGAHLTLASHTWYAPRGACSQKSHSHQQEKIECGWIQMMFTSECISTPNIAITSFFIASQRATTSLPVAPPLFTSTKACLS